MDLSSASSAASGIQSTGTLRLPRARLFCFSTVGREIFSNLLTTFSLTTVSLGVSKCVSLPVSFGVSPHSASNRGPMIYVFPIRVVRCFASVSFRVSRAFRNLKTVAVDFHPQRSISQRTDRGRVSLTSSLRRTPDSSKSRFEKDANPHKSTAARRRQYSDLSHSRGSLNTEAESARKRAMYQAREDGRVVHSLSNRPCFDELQRRHSGRRLLRRLEP